MPYDRKKNPLKTIIAARAEATIALSEGRCNMNATTNTIPAAIAAKGIQYLKASEDLSSIFIFPSTITNEATISFSYQEEPSPQGLRGLGFNLLSL